MVDGVNDRFSLVNRLKSLSLCFTMPIGKEAADEIERLQERVKELEADAKRWHFVRQFMVLDDVGDEDFCLGLITYVESLSERVDPAASRLYRDRWEARYRAEYRGEELDQGEITVDEAIDAAMQEGE